MSAGLLTGAETEPTPISPETPSAIQEQRDSVVARNAALRAQIRKERRQSRERVARVRQTADARVDRAAARSSAGVDAEKAIRLAAIAHDLPQERMLAIARCESGLNPSANAGPYLGLFQFGTPLWGTTPYAEYTRDDPQAAALAAAWAFARGMDSHWPVCGKR